MVNLSACRPAARGELGRELRAKDDKEQEVISQFREMSVNHIELYHTVPAKPLRQLIASGTSGLLVISHGIQYRRFSTLSVVLAPVW